MMLPLMLFLLAGPAHPAPVAPQSDPAVKVWLADDRVDPGDWVRVKARLADDGYLLVLAADPQGDVRVLYPLDPGGDAFVRAGRTVDIRGRGGNGAFLAGQAGGTGGVLAVRTAQPIRFDGFVRDGHWDYAALDSAVEGSEGARQANPDELLLGLAQQLAGGNQLDYDAASYTVGSDLAYGGQQYSSPPVYIDDGWSYGYGYPYVNPWYGCYDPWFCGPGYFGGFAFGVFFNPFAYRPYYYPYYYRGFGPRPAIVRGYGYGRGSYAVTGYRDRRIVASPPSVQYRGRVYAPAARASAGGRRYAVPTPRSAPRYAPSRSSGPRYAPSRSAGPRMAAPSFRGGGGARGGGGGRRGR